MAEHIIQSIVGVAAFLQTLTHSPSHDMIRHQQHVSVAQMLRAAAIMTPHEAASMVTAINSCSWTPAQSGELHTLVASKTYAKIGQTPQCQQLLNFEHYCRQIEADAFADPLVPDHVKMIHAATLCNSLGAVNLSENSQRHITTIVALASAKDRSPQTLYGMFCSFKSSIKRKDRSLLSTLSVYPPVPTELPQAIYDNTYMQTPPVVLVLFGNPFTYAMNVPMRVTSKLLKGGSQQAAFPQLGADMNGTQLQSMMQFATAMQQMGLIPRQPSTPDIDDSLKIFPRKRSAQLALQDMDDDTSPQALQSDGRPGSSADVLTHGAALVPSFLQRQRSFTPTRSELAPSPLTKVASAEMDGEVEDDGAIASLQSAMAAAAADKQPGRRPSVKIAAKAACAAIRRPAAAPCAPPTAKSKATTIASCSAKATATPPPLRRPAAAANAKAKAKANAKAKARPLGCSKCRYLPNGCGQCRNPLYTPR